MFSSDAIGDEQGCRVEFRIRELHASDVGLENYMDRMRERSAIILAVRCRSNIFLSGDPRRKNNQIGRLESHQVGAISGCELAERLPETHERRRMRCRKLQRVRQSNAEQANAILNRRCHVENRAGKRSILGDAAALAHSDGLSVEAEM